MSGYASQNQFKTDYIGVTSSNTSNTDFNSNVTNPFAGPGAMNSHGIPVHQQHQQHQPQSQPQSLLYDMSAFDPLQQSALQLSVSAGLTTADILAAATAPATIAPSESNSNVSTAAAPPSAGIGAGIPQPVPSYSQSLSQPQAPAHGAATSIAAAAAAAATPVSIAGGQLQPIQPVPAPTLATTTQHPYYIFIQPQHQQIAPNTVASAATTAFSGTPAAAAPNSLLMPAAAAAAAAGVPGAATSHAAAAASLAASTQANAAAAAAAGLGPHSLLFDPAFLTAAGLAAAGSPGQVLQQHHTQLQAAATQTQAQRHHAHVAPPNAMGHTLILPAAINPHPAAISKKRSLGSGIVMNEIAPSVVSLATSPLPEATNKRQRGSGSGQSRKVKYAEEAFKAEDPTEKRRHERNLREQQRSSKISSQIKELREVLSDCNVPFKPNKFSILLKVVEYIKQLQSRAIMLDAEHQKLITTVRQTNEMVTNSANNNNVMSSTTCADNESSDTTCQDAWQQGGDRMNAHPSRRARGESELFFVKGIDYRSVFEQCPTAFGIAALDGRILECNVEFQNILGYSSREDLWKQSLFNLVHNHQDIFRAMAQMLKTAEEPTPKSASASSSGANGAGNNSMDRFWTGPVTSKRNIKLSMNITLTSGDNGTPKFFSCALTNTVA